MSIFKPRYIQVCTLDEALELRGGNKTLLAEELGINRMTLRSRIESNREYLVEVVLGESFKFKLIN